MHREPGSTARCLAVFAASFSAFALFAALSSAAIGEIPTMSVVSIVAIVVLMVGTTTNLLTRDVTVGIGAAWPCSMLLALLSFGDLGPSLRPVRTIETPADLVGSWIYELPAFRVQTELSASGLQTTRYFDSVTKAQKTMTERFLTAPLVDAQWTSGGSIALWVGCTNLTDSLEDCSEVWSSQPLYLLRVDPAVEEGLRQAVQTAEQTHDLTSAPEFQLVQALTAEQLAQLRRLPHITLVVLAIGLLVGGLVVLKAAPRSA